MLLNKITFPKLLDTEPKQIDALKVLAFADDVSVVWNSTYGNFAALIAEVRYVPEGVTFGIVDTAFQWSVKRQDAKSVNVIPLSTATIGQGLIINETTFGASAESYFTNSYLVNVGADVIRVGLSNFTQTVDNNPFSSLTASGVLYYQID